MPVSEMRITEQSGRRRAIGLVGRSLPFQGVAFPASQRVAIDWMPGNPIAAAQVNGPTVDPTDLAGRWSDLFLFEDRNAAKLINFPALHPPTGIRDLGPRKNAFKSGGTAPSQRAKTASGLRDAAYMLVNAGQLIKLEWGTIVRYGFLVNFTPTHDREEDIDWTMRFEWIGTSSAQPVPAKQKKDILSLLKQLVATVTNALDQLSRGVFAIEAIKRKVSQGIIRLGSLAEELFGALERIVNLALTPFELLGTIKATLKGIQLAANDLLGAFADLSAAVATASGGDPAEVSFNNGAQQAMQALLRRLAAEGRLGQLEIDDFQSPEIRAIVNSQQGQTLRDISFLEYGTANNWRAIQDFNGFESSVLPAGTLVRVPRL